MILIDSNVFMYAAGAAHPNKQPSAALLRKVAAGEIAATVDAEVLQEILHRYRAIRRWDDGRRVYEFARRVVPSVEPVTVEITDDARQLLEAYDHLVARDAVHAAVCLRRGFDGICSYDSDFDQIAQLKRIKP